MAEPIMEYRPVEVVWGSRDIPRPQPGEMQLYIKDGVVEMVDFLCPCGCGNRVPTHVVTIAEKLEAEKDPAKHTAWKNSCWGFDRDTLTLHPSVRWLSGCKAHFHIKSGKTEFCSDSGK